MLILSKFIRGLAYLARHIPTLYDIPYKIIYISSMLNNFFVFSQVSTANSLFR